MKSLTFGFLCSLLDKYQLLEELGASICRDEKTKTALYRVLIIIENQYAAALSVRLSAGGTI
jgi:hypothetical protein